MISKLAENKKTPRKKVFLICMLMLMLILPFVSLQTTQAATKKIALSKTKVFVEYGKQASIKLKNTPKNAKVTWKTSDKKVATVKKGKITAGTIGQATITAKYKGKSYKCTVTVDVKENGVYDSKDAVAAYINKFEKLPSNYITKKQANELGWPGGSLEAYAPGKSIGGDYFGNYEGSLPQKEGREYHECDIDTLRAKSRGAKRIVYSNDRLIYYTEDHYETFVLLYGKE